VRESHEVQAALRAAGVLPILVPDDADTAVTAAGTLADAGLPCVEVVMRTPGALAALEAIAASTDVLAGAGTVLSVGQVHDCVAAGAQFVLSPGFDRDVVRACLDAGVHVIPGVATASELQAALAMGLTTVKLFPAEAIGGLRLLDALSDPFSQVTFVPTGGIRQQTMGDWISRPSVLAVGGTWLAGRARVANRDFDAIAADAQAAVATVNEVRSRA
jgi:2-dehydro-3-deoxyphosphogluconate aldolase/(4S)-4-hydroxy-2-oxoglutarate aldolase